ncbi:PAS domain S-box protein [Taibaiella soli]|uniref:PAS domain S-box protein n=1 Tax=Taibaiella soli TaxID=1649169 RepID=UPI0014032004|nr:PAS domain S-box protein [Taibaiella soli]
MFVLLLGLIQVPTWQEYRMQQEKEHQVLLRELSSTKTRFLDLLYNDVAAANTLAILSKEYDVSHDFDSIARQILCQSKYASAIQINWNGIIKNVYPLAGYEHTIGLNTHRDSLRLSEENRALEKGDVFFAGPRALRSGGEGILGKVPIIVDGKLKGIVVILTEMNMVRKALDVDGADSEFTYLLSKNIGADTTVYSLSEAKPGARFETISVQIPQGDWTLSVSYSSLHHAAGFPFVLSLLGGMLAFLGGYLTFRKIREPYLLNKIIELKTKTLSESEQKFRNLVERSLVGVYIAQGEKFVYVNPRFAEIQDTIPEALIGQSIYSILHPEDVAIVGNSVRQRAENELDTVHYETRSITQKNRAIWMEIYGTTTIYDGAPAIIGTALDITERKEFVEALERRESELQAFFNNIEGAACMLDDQKKYVIFNERFIADHSLLTNEPPEKGMEVYDLFPAEIMETRRSLIDRVIRDGRKETVEAMYLKGERKIYYRTSFNPIIANGKVTGVATYSFDLTPVKEAESEILRVNRLYQFISSINESVLKLQTQEEIFTKACEIAVEVGKFQMAWIGTYEKSNDLIVPVAWAGAEDGFLTAIGAEAYKASTSSIPSARAIRNSNHFYYNDIANSPDIPERIKKEMLRRNYRSGLSFPIFVNSEIVGAFILLMSEPFFFNEEEVKLLREVTDNITFGLDRLRIVELQQKEIADRKMAEAELLKSQANMRSILGNTEVGFLLLDINYHLIATNKKFDEGFAKAMGVQFKVNISYLDQIHEQRRSVVSRFFETVKNNRKPAEWETGVEGPAGVFYFSISLMPVISEDEVIGFNMSATDITARKALEIERERMTADLVQRNKDLEQFAYIVSHNLRAPVANILGISALLQDDSLSAEEQSELNAGLYTSVSKLDTVVGDLNAILQIRREISEVKEDIGLAALVASIKENLRQLIAQNVATIECDFTAVECFYSVKSYIHSIFYHLIINGIKYRKQNAPCVIFIESRKEDNKLVLLFRDNGTGIDLEKHGDKIFGLYKRFHNHIEGKGMGLYIVKTQVETLGGTISIDSKTGLGTEFKIKFEL